MARHSKVGIPGVSARVQKGRLVVKVLVNGDYISHSFDPSTVKGQLLTHEARRWIVDEGLKRAGTGDGPGRLSIVEAVGTYLLHLKAEGCQPKTASTINALAAALQRADLVDMRSKDWGIRMKAWLGGLGAGWREDPLGRGSEAEPLEPTTRQLYFGMIRTVVTAFRERRQLQFDPLIGVKNFKVPKKLKPTFTADELRELVGTRSERDAWWIPACLLTYTGARAQEAFGLRWEWIDWGAGVIRLRQQDAATTDETFGLKTGERLIPLMDELRAILWPRRKASGFIIEEESMRTNGTHEVRERGDTLKHDYSRAFDRFLGRCGIAKDGRSPHSLRHTYIAMRLARGESFHRVMDAVGHANPKTTLLYGRLRAAYASVVRDWPVGEFRLRPQAPHADLVVIADAGGDEDLTIDLGAIARGASRRSG